MDARQSYTPSHRHLAPACRGTVRQGASADGSLQLRHTAVEYSVQWTLRSKSSYMSILRSLLLCAGITHWQSPNFFAYFPSNSSFPAMLGDMLSTALSTVGFCWIGSPATTELETVRTTPPLPPSRVSLFTLLSLQTCPIILIRCKMSMVT